MVELLKKTLYSAVGMAYLTKEKAEELGKRLAKDVDLSEDEGKKFVNELIKSSEEARESLRKTVGDIVESTLRRLDVPTATDMAELKERVRRLEERETGNE